MLRADAFAMGPMLIDIRTMLVVLAVSSLLMALMLWLAFPGSRDGLGMWAMGLVLQGCAWTLFAARGLSSELLILVFGNLLYVSGLALKAVSLVQFQRRPLSRWSLWLPLERTDAALYRAKQAGRNRIASYVPLSD